MKKLSVIDREILAAIESGHIKVILDDDDKTVSGLDTELAIGSDLATLTDLSERVDQLLAEGYLRPKRVVKTEVEWTVTLKQRKE